MMVGKFILSCDLSYFVAAGSALKGEWRKDNRKPRQAGSRRNERDASVTQAGEKSGSSLNQWSPWCWQR